MTYSLSTPGFIKEIPQSEDEGQQGSQEPQETRCAGQGCRYTGQPAKANTAPLSCSCGTMFGRRCRRTSSLRSSVRL
jgi:hypothetical protein